MQAMVKERKGPSSCSTKQDSAPPVHIAICTKTDKASSADATATTARQRNLLSSASLPWCWGDMSGIN